MIRCEIVYDQTTEIQHEHTKKTKLRKLNKKSKLFRFSGKKIVSWHTNNNLWLRKSIKCNWEKVVELIVWTELSLCVRTRRTGLIEIQIGFMPSFRNQIQYYDVSMESVGKQNISMCLLSIFNSVNKKICNQKGHFFSCAFTWNRMRTKSKPTKYNSK